MPKLPPKAKTRKSPKAKQTEKRTRIKKFHSSQKWTNISLAYRAKFGVCQRCIFLKVVDMYSVRGLQVHHIEAVRANFELNDHEENLLSLCPRCHTHFTTLENTGKRDISEAQGTEIKASFDMRPT